MALLKNLFSSQNKEPHNFTRLETDIHSHLIPAIDDGSKSLDESIELLKQLEKTGIKRIVCTPHVNDYYPNNHNKIIAAFKKLKASANEAQINIELDFAAEYLLNSFIDELLEKDELLSFSKYKYILIELSFFSPQPNYKELISKIQDKGYSVILVHPERYSYWHNNIEPLIDLKNKGVNMQLNLLSLTGFHGHSVKKQAQYLLKENVFNFAGTDTHNQKYIDEFHDVYKNKLFINAMKNNIFKNQLLYQ